MSRGLRAIVVGLLGMLVSEKVTVGDTAPSYEELRAAFVSPDHSRWGEVPLWWWEGDRLTKKRVTWQLETLAAKGVKSVCPIQRSPGRCDPQSFDPQWWDLLAFVNRECQRLGMTLWAYDQVGYGHYGWLEKAAAKAQDHRTARVVFLTAEGDPGKPIRLELPQGRLIGARAYPLEGGHAEDARSVNVADSVRGEALEWAPPAGTWRVAVSVAVPQMAFQLSDTAADTFLDMLYGEAERRLGQESMGTSFVGMFQDEHPPTPRDVYTDRLAADFCERFGYEIARAIPALHFDVGPLTAKYRTDFFDAYLSEDERCYWKRVFDWTEARGILTSHDNWGRNSLPQQSQGYIDYFRTQRWFSAPGYDDSGQHPVDRRNYYDTKIAASIARLYGRPRVWSEAFHSSGWGRTTDQTLSWLSANYAFGANLYDEHGLYYSARASTWEHAAPDPHWRQPYWRYYGTLSDWVARMSHLMSQGKHVVDVAVHYPAVSHLAGELPGQKGPDYNLYMRLSRTIYDAAMDNDIIDDDSILAGKVQNGRLIAADNGYQALVFGPETTMRRAVLEQALRLAESGGCVLFFERLPSASPEAGRDDPQLAELLQQLLGELPTGKAPSTAITRNFPSGGFAAFVPSGPEELPKLISDQIERDFVPSGSDRVFVAHRQIGDVHAYLLQNPSEAPIDLEARCRVDGVAELWDPSTGKVRPVQRFERSGGTTRVRLRLEGNTAHVLVFHPGEQRSGSTPVGLLQPDGLEQPLSKDWTFSVIPTRDNRWGEFRWPPSEELIGPEVRSFRYTEETSQPGTEQGWHLPDCADSGWSTARYSIGPYWLVLPSLPANNDAVAGVLGAIDRIAPGSQTAVAGKPRRWQTVEFSKTIGLARPAPWGGHSGYPDGAVDQNFIELPKGRKLLFTRIRSPKEQRLGLRVALRNSTPRLWVNGIEQPFEDAVGNLPLRGGVNTVLLDLPDGGQGMLYVQATPPSVSSLAEAAAATAKPDLREASWIRTGKSGSCYLRKTFRLAHAPKDARIVVTGYTGYRLFINGKKVEEEIGPWAKWTHPESINITPLLRQGENVMAAWIQVHSGQHFHGAPEDLAFAMSLKAQMPKGEAFSLASDASWKGALREQDGWQELDFNDVEWQPVLVAGRMGDSPWGMEPVENVGLVTEPRRKLAIDLPSPNLTCFDEVPDIAYDVKSPDAKRVGWYRFDASPGLRKLLLRSKAPARVWVDGVSVPVRDGVATVAEPSSGVSRVAVRLEMEPGSYGGAAFPLPLGLELGGGTIQLGEWAEFALPTYSGIGVYRQTVTLDAQQSRRPTELDLGEVLVAAEVLVNGKPAGVRLARPFTFDLTQLVHEGDNTIEVRVANTIAPHYTVTNRVQNLGPTASGLIGPVVLCQQLPLQAWSTWAENEISELHGILETSTPALEAAQKVWGKQQHWTVLEPADMIPASGSSLTKLPDAWIGVRVERPTDQALSLGYETHLTGITGFRFEAVPAASATQVARRDSRPPFEDIQIVASLPDKKRFRGCIVRVQIVDRTEYLHLAEVQVFSGGENTALREQARQSSVSLGALAGLAIDDNTDGSWGGKSVCHTLNEKEPWWEVDLGSVQPIDRIVIWNRTDGNLETRLSPFRVSLLDESGKVVWQRLQTEPPDPNLTLALSPLPVGLRALPVPEGKTKLPGQRQAFLFETDTAVGFPVGTHLAVGLSLPSGTGYPVERYRLSATALTPPLHDVPPSIAKIVANGPDRRTDQDRATLGAFYRSIAPELQPIRNRLARLKADVARVTSP